MVRIYAGRLRVHLESYYSIRREADCILISIPKGGYTPRFTGLSNMRLPLMALAAFM